MINIAIVEDEAMYAKQLQEFLQQYQKENGEVFNITVYSDGDQIVHKYKSQFDIILMDVEMKFMDGMSAAEEIRKVDTEVVIIFITNMAQYAIRGYAVDALDYVLKPVSYFAFSQRLNRAISRMKKREQKVITVNIKGGAVRINIANIYYIESQGHNLVLHTILGDHTRNPEIDRHISGCHQKNRLHHKHSCHDKPTLPPFKSFFQRYNKKHTRHPLRSCRINPRNIRH